MQTERHAQIAKIAAANFTTLLVEEARSTNSTSDEIASYLKTELGSPTA